MPDTGNRTSSLPQTPPAVLLHYSILLTGFGTVFLGPLLPLLSGMLHTSDSGGGALIAAQFIGAFFGGWTTRSPLQRSMALGYGAAIAGFAGLGLCCYSVAGSFWFRVALVVLGFGIGQLLTSTNLLASRKWAHHRGAALTLLNFSWSLGALTAPLLLLRLLQAHSAGTLLLGMALLLLAGFTAALLTGSLRSPEEESGTNVEETARGLSFRRYLFFSLLLVIYGGVETSMSGWLTTYDNRYGAGLFHQMALSTTIFWACLTSARALATAVLLRFRESLLLRGGLALAILALGGLLSAHSVPMISLCAGLLGIALAPWFPLVLSQMVGESVKASQAGKIIAASGLGAASLPWLVGQISAATGSLRLGLILPIVGVAALLLCSLIRSETSVPEVS